MLTAKTIELADRMPELMARLKETQARRGVLERDELERREAFAGVLARVDGEVRGIESEIRNAGLARQAILNEVQVELRTALDRAGVELRKQAAVVDDSRREVQAAKALFDRARQDPTTTTAERDALAAQLARAEAEHAKDGRESARLGKVHDDASAALEAAVEKIRRAVVVGVKPTEEQPKAGRAARAGR